MAATRRPSAAGTLSTAAYLERAYLPLRPAYSFPRSASAQDWSAWRRRFRAALRRALEMEALGPVPTPNARVVRSEDRGPYTRHELNYETLPGNRVRAFLLVPNSGRGRLPAVICPHGHVAGAAEAVVEPAKALGAAYGHELAMAGVVALCPDNAGNGPRHDPDATPTKDGCQLLWRRLNHLGLDVTGFRVFELMAGIHLLRSHPRVDGNRIGAAGLSGGCWLSQVLTALDRRVRAVILSGYFTTFRQTAWVGHCVCHHPKAIGTVCEMYDIAALIAPRPMFVESGTRDTPYPVEPAFARTRQAYRLLGAADRLRLDRYEGGHLFYGRNSIPWLMEQLTR